MLTNAEWALVEPLFAGYATLTEDLREKPKNTSVDVTTRWFPGDPEPEDDRYR